MPEPNDLREWPEVERRSTDPPPPDAPRRRVEDRNADSIRDIERRLTEHEAGAREWRSAHDARLEDVEERADLLDGRAGNDDGIIGKMGELRGVIGELVRRMDRQAEVFAALQEDVRELKRTTAAIDGHTTPAPAKTRGEQLLDVLVRVVLPVLLVLIPVLGTIIAGYLQLKGQLIDVKSP